MPTTCRILLREYLQSDLADGRRLLTVIALSGDHTDLTRIDDLFPELFPDEDQREWITLPRKHPSLGLPARSFSMNPTDAVKLGKAINDLAARGEIKAPAAIGRSFHKKRDQNPLRSQLPPHSADPSKRSPDTLVDSPELAALLRAASGRGLAFRSGNRRAKRNS